MLRPLMVLFILVISLPSQAGIIGGNPKGRVTLEFIYDYQCPHCHAMYPIIQSLIKNNPQLKVKWLPVAILNNLSLEQAATALAAAHSTPSYSLYQNVSLTGLPLTNSQNQSLLENLGLNTPDFLLSRHQVWIKTVLMEDRKKLKALNMTAVPVCLIYSTSYPAQYSVFLGEQSYQTLQEAINHDNPSH
jgi:predicted DsbA family dithiol-disulfide isomerase